MARIPESEIERLKTEVSLARLAKARGVVLKRQGADLLGLCPFHDDREPSLVVSPQKNLWHCLGACQAGGTVIDWVMRAEGVSFRHAVELLREGLPSRETGAGSRERGERPVKRSTVRTLPAPVSLDADGQALLNQVIGYYHAALKQCSEGLAYLEKRGIANPEAIDRFQLGYANRTLGLRLPEKSRKAGAELRGRLERLGLYRESGHEHFNGSLVIPVIDAAGNVQEVYGRKLRDDLRPGTPAHLYLPGPHRGVWNVEALQASREILLCESLIDALTFWCAGYRNVTASYGVEGFTDDHWAAFKQYGTERVLIAYDRDAAGESAAEKLAARLMAEGLECFRVQFPKGMDANDYALKVGPAGKSLGLVIRKAVWLGKGPAPRIETEASAVPPAANIAPPRPAETPAPFLAAALPAPASAAMVPIDPPLPASPVPPLPSPEIPAAVKDGEVVMAFGDRRYRVRGLAKNLGVESLKVNVLVSCGEATSTGSGQAFHVDTFDLYAARPRAQYIGQAAAELRLKEEVVKHDLGRLLLRLEALQEEVRAQALQPKAPAHPEMAEADRQAALAWLQSPNLMERLLADFERLGLVGEAVNKEVAYLAVTSRKLDKPLGVVIQSSSAAGKTSLLDGVLALVPEEERIKYSAMTGQSLYYLGETNLKHKVLALVEEEGASRASYALKLLQSEGELTMASTGKDPVTGNLVTQAYRVEGPVALLLTTTARDLDEELVNRCLVLSVDEGREQTRAIHRRQRENRTLEGLLARREREALARLHQNAQRLLKPLAVLNPYVRFLTFPDQTTRLRRDHEKYLTLIDAIALLHQYQRPHHSHDRGGTLIEYLEATLDDIALANRLAHEVLGRSLDELPPQTRRLLRLIDGYAAAECEKQAMKRCDFRFSRRQLREALSLGDTQLKVHLARLVELEYLLAHRTKTGGFEYELVYEVGPDDGALRCPGLIDVDALRCAYDGARSGLETPRPDAGRGEVGARPAGGRGGKTAGKPDATPPPDPPHALAEKTLISKGSGKSRSYPQHPQHPQQAGAVASSL